MLDRIWQYGLEPLACRAIEQAGKTLDAALHKATLALGAGMFATIGLAWISWAGFAHLSRHMDSVAAATLVAVAFFLIAAFAGWQIRRGSRRRRDPGKPEIPDDPPRQDIEEALNTAERILRGKAGSAATIALVAGIAAGMASDHRP